MVGFAFSSCVACWVLVTPIAVQPLTTIVVVSRPLLPPPALASGSSGSSSSSSSSRNTNAALPHHGLYAVQRHETTSDHFNSKNTATIATTTTTTTRTTRTKRGPNTRVRTLLQGLADRLELPATDPTWIKTKMYLYHTDSLSSNRQIDSVLNVLLQYKGQMEKQEDQDDDEEDDDDEERYHRDDMHEPQPNVLDTALVRHVIQSSPRLLRRNPQTFVLPTLHFLHGLYGTDRLPEALQRNPDLLLTRGTGYNDRQDLNLVAVFLQQQVGFTKKQIRELQQKHPFILQLSLTSIMPTTYYLMQILRDGIDDNGNDNDDIDEPDTDHKEQRIKRSMVKIILTFPRLLTLSVEQNLKPSVAYLCHRCQLSAAEFSKCFKKCHGQILTLSVENNLAPKLDLFDAVLSGEGYKDNQRNREASPQSELLRNVLRHPSILGMSLDTLRAKIEYFDTFGVAARILMRAPSVYALNLEGNIKPKIQFLAGIWGYDHSSETTHVNTFLANQLHQNPVILTLSLEDNLRPTVGFYNRTGYIRLDGEWKLRDRHHTNLLTTNCIQQSLYRRLLPRWHFAKSVVSTTSGTTKDQKDMSAKPPLPTYWLVSLSDPAFCDAIGVPQEEYEFFKNTTWPRLKFGDQFANWLRTGRPIRV